MNELEQHLQRVRACIICARMHRPAVVGQPARSRVLLVGQAPGVREPQVGRPFAWTAGRTLFRWFREGCGVDEETFRATVYMAAVCRCFPGRLPGASGDRVPDIQEVANCSRWLRAEFALLKPDLVVPVGKLAIAQFMAIEKLDRIIGQQFRAVYHGHHFDLIPLPHPSGASPWPRMEPGRTLLGQAMGRIAGHAAWVDRMPLHGDVGVL